MKRASTEDRKKTKPYMFRKMKESISGVKKRSGATLFRKQTAEHQYVVTES